MYISEITVKQHLKELNQEARMRRMSTELHQAQPARHWVARLFALLRRRQAEMPELKVLPPAQTKATLPMRRAS